MPRPVPPAWGRRTGHVRRRAGRWDDAIAAYQAHSVLMDYVPLTPAARRRLNELADLQPHVLAAMHGSTFVGDGGAALRSAAEMLQRRLGAVPVDAQRAA